MLTEAREKILNRLGQTPTPDQRYQIQLDQVLHFEKDTDLPESVQRQLAHLRTDLPNIPLLYYGGTLGMVPDENGNLVPTDDVEALLKPLKIKDLDEEVNAIWFPILPKAIDSTNGRWPHWVSIANAIKKLYTDFPDKPGGINGFSVAGGTDTMAHMSAGLRYIFPNIGRPIIPTGSQKPIFKGGSDADGNLYFSFGVASRDIAGVHQAFGNILRDGLHIHKVRDRNFNAFDCPRGYELGEMNSDGIEILGTAPKRNPYVIASELDFRPEFREGIKVIKLSPTTPSEAILHDALDPNCEALLIITYGAGNVRDEGLTEDELTHIEALEILREAQYPVVLGSAMMDGVVDSPYASGAKALAKGVEAISARNTTGASLEVKMMRALALAHSGNNGFDYFEFRKQMERNHVGELTSFARR